MSLEDSIRLLNNKIIQCERYCIIHQCLNCEISWQEVEALREVIIAINNSVPIDAINKEFDNIIETKNEFTLQDLKILRDKIIKSLNKGDN